MYAYLHKRKNLSHLSLFNGISLQDDLKLSDSHKADFINQHIDFMVGDIPTIFLVILHENQSNSYPEIGQILRFDLVSTLPAV